MQSDVNLLLALLFLKLLMTQGFSADRGAADVRNRFAIILPVVITVLIIPSQPKILKVSAPQVSEPITGLETVLELPSLCNFFLLQLSRY